MKFFTEWRLRKHRKIHSDEKTRPCLYFKNQIRCPFDELGCKFRHSTGFQETTSNSRIKENPTELSESSIDIQNFSRESEDNVEIHTFYISTPKKQDNSIKNEWFKCEKCINSSLLINKSQCIDCYLNEHMHSLHMTGLSV